MRQACCVPFCRRTRPDDGRYTEWLCREHWRSVRPRLRLLVRRSGRRLKAGETHLRALHDRAWAKAKAEAVERAAGVE